MNKMNRLLLLAVALCAGLSILIAAEKRVEAGPKGGRVLAGTSPKAEFHVEKDHTVTIAFYDEKQKPLPPGDQTVTVIADAKDGKTKLEFERKGDVLVSKTKLPEGDGYNLVVQVRQTADAKPQNFRFKLDLSVCGGCKQAEYACTCH
jgi:hypothetical protein